MSTRRTRLRRAVRIGAALSVTGRFARFGTQAAQGLVSWRELTEGVEVVVEDDASDPQTLRKRLSTLAPRCDLMLGPYSTALMRAAAEVAAAEDLLMWNHGGSGDDVQALAPGHVVSVLSPTSRYAEGFVRYLGALPEKAPLVLVQGRGRFARQVIAGAERDADRIGIRTVRADAGLAPTVEEPWDLFTAGTFEEDVAQVSAVRAAARQPRTIGTVAAGVREFHDAVPDCDGVFGVAQWLPTLPHTAEIGPTEERFLKTYRRRAGVSPDYPAVQAAAGAALAVHCAEAAASVARNDLWAMATRLRTSTMFGEFAVDPSDGRQVGHRMALARWTGGRLGNL